MSGRVKIYLAPMEGVATAEYREVLRRHYPGADKYFTPFLAANQTHNFKKREKRELLPLQKDLVPQILANKAEDFVWAARELADIGYAEINLNLGCPSATVVSKGRGAGMLADPEKLDRFFEEVFRCPDLPYVSVKTRLGLRNAAEEAETLGKIYARYPFSEVIIHARVREDYYKKPADPQGFELMRAALSGAGCCNGDLQDFERKRPALDASVCCNGDLRDFERKRPALDASVCYNGDLQDFERNRPALSGAVCYNGDLRDFERKRPAPAGSVFYNDDLQDFERKRPAPAGSVFYNGDLRDFERKQPALGGEVCCDGERQGFEPRRAVTSGEVCYNGDLRTAEDVERITARFPEISAVMIGRGIIAAPWRIREMRGSICSESLDYRRELALFLDDLWETYRRSLSGDRDVLFKMKELWYYLGQSFPEQGRALLDIKKARTREEYRRATGSFL